MFSKIGRNGVRFSIKPPAKAGDVCLAGSFNGWKPLPMRPAQDGSYTVSVPLSPGKHEYKFIVDGAWLIDPDNQAIACNPYGSSNSTVQV